MIFIIDKKRHVKNNPRYTKLIALQGKIIPLHPKIIHGSLISHTSTKTIPDIYEFKYRQNKKRHMSKIIPARGTKMIPVHPKVNSR